MNPGIGAPELMVLAVLALIVVGPKDLPMMFRRIGRFVGQARQMARDFQRSFDEMGRENEMADLRREIEALKAGNPAADLKRDLEDVKRDLASLEHEDIVQKKIAAADMPSGKEDMLAVSADDETIHKPGKAGEAKVEPYSPPPKQTKTADKAE
ncbi:Sec-independent protein translocase protein TatB [Hyphobacterium sp.]|jgi:sec-independent protein translocase protein TatB|uniref:Sec-independent protein translocase protein TatB n=1 Tax=Hyphobacterium sp. TaxID=2004662 RepID=UPI003BACED29